MKREILKGIRPFLNDYFFAPNANCLGCSTRLGAVMGFLCPDCYASLSPLYTTFESTKYICHLCGREIAGLKCRCGSPLKKAIPAYSAYHFELPVSTLVKAFKYRSVTKLSEWMADEMIKALKGEKNFDAVTYVPMHFVRRIKRGYNQSQILAKLISEKMNIPLKPMLRRKRFTRKQASLNRNKRRTNLINAITIKDKDIKGMNILLIDDVRTTGTTIITCAKVLKENGAGKISALTLTSSKYM